MAYQRGDGAWWSITALDENWVWGRDIYDVFCDVYRVTNDKHNGFFVRCVRD